MRTTKGQQVKKDGRKEHAKKREGEKECKRTAAMGQAGFCRQRRARKKIQVGALRGLVVHSDALRREVRRKRASLQDQYSRDLLTGRKNLIPEVLLL
jgi:hypothetical protein